MAGLDDISNTGNILNVQVPIRSIIIVTKSILILKLYIVKKTLLTRHLTDTNNRSTYRATEK